MTDPNGWYVTIIMLQLLTSTVFLQSMFDCRFFNLLDSSHNFFFSFFPNLKKLKKRELTLALLVLVLLTKY